MTARQLFEQTLAVQFPSGIPENLLGVDANSIPTTSLVNGGILQGFFAQSLFDLQKAVACYKYGQHDVLPHCASYFSCGMTVVPKPQGQITSIYTTDKLNAETGLEDADGEDEPCAKVYYQEVQWCFMSRYMKMCERSESTISTVADTLADLLFGTYRTKRRYPRPTDEGLEGLPPLPSGFKYPQVSTDAEGRSPNGVFAFKGGQIWIAPWIQSTETLHVLFNGIKRTWSDFDLVDDDPKFKQAIRLHVAHQYESCYGDPSKANDYHDQLWGNLNRGMSGAIPTLIHECKEGMVAAKCGDASSLTGAARGLGQQSNLYYNDQRFEHTAYCPAGKTGGPVTAVKEIGSVSSAKSVADANARASQAAADEAAAGLVCTDAVVTYLSVAVIGHASCPAASDGTPAADGPDTTATLPAGYATSTVSQAAADATAQAAADALALQALVCTYWNKEQTVTVSCPAGQTGDDESATVAAHTYSALSQTHANQLAINEANRLALLELTCDAVTPPVFYSTYQQVGPFYRPCTKISHVSGSEVTHCQFTVTIYVNIAAGSVAGTTQDGANAAAIQGGINFANSIMNAPNFCQSFPICEDQARTYQI